MKYHPVFNQTTWFEPGQLLRSVLLALGGGTSVQVNLQQVFLEEFLAALASPLVSFKLSNYLRAPKHILA